MPEGFNLNSLLAQGGTTAAGALNMGEHQRVSVFDMVPTKSNFYSTAEIEGLKIAIQVGGVQQDIRLKPGENGKYLVNVGHRRRLACIALVEEGYPEYEYPPSFVERVESQLIDRFNLIATNSTQRRLTDWEEIEQYREMSEIMKQIKAERGLPGRVRDLTAAILQTNTTRLAQFDVIRKHLIPEFVEELKAKRVALNAAHAIAQLPADAQGDFYGHHKARGMASSISDVAEYKANLKPPEPPREDPQDPTPAADTPPVENLKVGMVVECGVVERFPVAKGHETVSEDLSPEARPAAAPSPREVYRQAVDSKEDRQSPFAPERKEPAAPPAVPPENRLKTLQPFFDDVKAGRKPFELRKNDRNFQVGDVYELWEWNGVAFTGEFVTVCITYVLEGFPGLAEGYCIFGFDLLEV